MAFIFRKFFASRESIIVRKLRDHECSSFQQFLLGLDHKSRRDRFCSTVSDTFLAKYAEQTWRTGAVVVGAFSGGQLCGVAELHPAGRDGVAEAAFAVRPEFRKRGVGSSLLEAVLGAAANRGYLRVRTVCLPTNSAMRQLARKAGARLELTIDEVNGEITAPRPSILTWLREFTGHAFGCGRSLPGLP